MRHALQLPVLRCQPWLDERLIEQLSVMLTPGHGRGQALEEKVRA